jgi:hypothetical protein
MYTCVKGIDFAYVYTIFLLDFQTILTWPRVFFVVHFSNELMGRGHKNI